MDIKIHIFSSTNAIGKVVYFVYKTGEEDGYEVDVECASVYCRKCKKRVCSVEQFRKGTI